MTVLPLPVGVAVTVELVEVLDVVGVATADDVVEVTDDVDDVDAVVDPGNVVTEDVDFWLGDAVGEVTWETGATVVAVGLRILTKSRKNSPLSIKLVIVSVWFTDPERILDWKNVCIYCAPNC